MNVTFDEKWLREYEQRTGLGVQKPGGRAARKIPAAAEAPAGPGTDGRRSGCGAVKTERDGLSFDGKTEAGAEARTNGRRSKYGAVRTEFDGLSFDSKLEARVYAALKLRMESGEYIALARQVPFMLPGGVKYVADFVAFLPDGSYEVMDAKSEATRRDKVFRIKKKQMADIYGIVIKEV